MDAVEDTPSPKKGCRLPHVGAFLPEAIIAREMGRVSGPRGKEGNTNATRARFYAETGSN